ncbi:hypothetical protein MRX96_000268 [Rhipicephalus microplus]
MAHTGYSDVRCNVGATSLDLVTKADRHRGVSAHRKHHPKPIPPFPQKPRLRTRHRQWRPRHRLLRGRQRGAPCDRGSWAGALTQIASTSKRRPALLLLSQSEASTIERAATSGRKIARAAVHASGLPNTHMEAKFSAGRNTLPSNMEA